MTEDEFKERLYGPTNYAYYTADFSRTERARLFYARHRLEVITVASVLFGMAVGLLFSGVS